GHAESHDEEQRFAIAESIVVEVDRSGLDFRHDAGLLEVEKKNRARPISGRAPRISSGVCVSPALTLISPSREKRLRKAARLRQSLECSPDAAHWDRRRAPFHRAPTCRRSTGRRRPPCS